MARKKINLKNDDRKVAIYVRKSKVTETGKSIEIQKEKCKALAISRFDIEDEEKDIVIYEDDGKSGFYADRPNYMKMLNDIDKNKIKAVICYKIDRISRRTIDLLNLIEQMKQKKVDFISVSDQDIDTSSRTGKIMISLLSAIAEFERDIIAERITDNLYELAKEGRWLGGTTPLGYYSKKEKITVNGRKTTINHLEPVKDEQIIVKKIFEYFLVNNKFTTTANMINKEGYRTRKNKNFTAIAIKNILTNPVYAIADSATQDYFKSFDITIWADDKDFDGKRGIMAYNKTEQIKEIDYDSKALDPKYTQKTLRRDIKEWVVSVGEHRGFISGTDWIRVQSIISDIELKSARPKETTRALLSGLVRCVNCGSKMFVRSESGRYNPDGSVRFRYVCDVKYRKKGGCENSPNVKGYELDNFVIEQICNMSEADNAFYEELMNSKKILMFKTQEMEKELTALKKRLAQIDIDIQTQTTNLREAPEIIRQAIYNDLTNLCNEKEEKQNRINEILEERNKQEKQFKDIEKAKQTILNFSSLIELMGYEQKLELIRNVIECIIVKGDEVHIFIKGTDTNDFFQKECERGDMCHKEQDCIVNAFGGIGGEPYAFFFIKG